MLWQVCYVKLLLFVCVLTKVRFHCCFPGSDSSNWREDMRPWAQEKGGAVGGVSGVHAEAVGRGRGGRGRYSSRMGGIPYRWPFIHSGSIMWYCLVWCLEDFLAFCIWRVQLIFHNKPRSWTLPVSDDYLQQEEVGFFGDHNQLSGYVNYGGAVYFNNVPYTAEEAMVREYVRKQM